jgi:hypothetical protein
MEEREAIPASQKALRKSARHVIQKQRLGFEGRSRRYGSLVDDDCARQREDLDQHA